MMTDPIADMLTRVRNGLMIERPHVDIPHSKIKQGIADVLQREGYIWDYEILETEPARTLRVNLKYSPTGERVIQKIERVSKPGRRVYSNANDIPEVLNGMGICVLTTSKGVLSSREARDQRVGGEIVCQVW